MNLGRENCMICLWRGIGLGIMQECLQQDRNLGNDSWNVICGGLHISIYSQEEVASQFGPCYAESDALMPL